MPNTFRYIRGDVRAITLPGRAADAVEVGDLIYWDSSNGAARPAETVAGANYAARQTALAAAFLGVAMTSKAAAAAGSITVATDGDFLFAAPSGSGADYTVGDAVAGGNGTTMQDQGVVKTTDAARAIGIVAAAKTTAEARATVRLLSRAATLVPGAVVAGQTLSNSVAVPAGGSISFGTATLTRNGNNIIAALPTSNPAVAGALWNDGGTVKVSAGT